jgi:hypothetical protein
MKNMQMVCIKFQRAFVWIVCRSFASDFGAGMYLKTPWVAYDLQITF